MAARCRGTVDGRDGQARRRVAAALTIACWRDRAGRASVRSRPRRGAGSRFPSPGSPHDRARRRASSCHNLRALAAVGGLLLIAQSRVLGAARAQPGPRTGRCGGSARRCSAAAVAANVIVVGASFGAYGTRMVRAALPHGPVELAAYSLALALYLQGRTRRAPGPTRARGRWRSASRRSRSPPCSRPT